ncbi:unnamed protein product, partial [Rotaria magnacalcarata]
YETFKHSFVIWSLPLTGLVQSITAALTFTFLSRTKTDPGYYSDRGTLSYAFIVENSFFSGLLLFQWLYYSDFFYSYINNSIVIDNLIVFLPYILRQLWPKTHFRDSLNNSDKNKTAPNKNFYFIVTMVTKMFYVWAKHYIGYFLNYVRFFDRANPQQIEYIYLLLVFSAFATTISVFLHTLKFKGYIGPRTSYIIYMMSYLSTFYSFIQIRIDIHPIYNRQKVRFITTYLCQQPFSSQADFWFDSQPCDNMDRSMTIYEWYYNIPAVKWPKGCFYFTPFLYVVIQIQYFPSIINDVVYGEKIILIRERPKYTIGTYQIVTNSIEIQKTRAEFSCQYRSLPMQIFSIELYSTDEGKSISLYRVRNREVQSIIKGNLQWPENFYQVTNPVDIIASDYLRYGGKRQKGKISKGKNVENQNIENKNNANVDK